MEIKGASTDAVIQQRESCMQRVSTWRKKIEIEKNTEFKVTAIKQPNQINYYQLRAINNLFLKRRSVVAFGSDGNSPGHPNAARHILTSVNHVENQTNHDGRK